jgi:type III secretion protein O
MAMIDELLFIKKFRESKAEMELQKSRARLVVAVQAEDQAQHTLEHFIAHASAEELRLYADLCSRIVKLRDINDVHTEVASLKHREQDLQQTLQGCQQQHVQARQEVEASTQKMRDASAAREKFMELARNHHTLEAREAERKEELELEEVASIVREREDWGGAQA